MSEVSDLRRRYQQSQREKKRLARRVKDLERVVRGLRGQKRTGDTSSPYWRAAKSEALLQDLLPTSDLEDAAM